MESINPSVNTDDSGAVIVCGHVASERHPILLAERDQPDEPVDTGWQFLCNSGVDEDAERAQVWSLNDVLAFEPSLVGLLDQPPGTRLVRKDIASPWQIVKSS